MSDRRLVDTNLIVRHLTQDDENHAKVAASLFSACDRGDLTLVVLGAILAECVFVLESFYKLHRDDIAEALSELIKSPGVEIENAAQHVDALERYRTTRLHFVDCILAATAVAENMAIATFDRGFRKFSDVIVKID